MAYALTEHPEGGLVADPWEGVTVRAAIRPRPTMPGWMMAAKQADLFETRSLTLTEALAAAGYTHREAPGVRRRRVMRDGVEVFAGTAGEVWDWLKGGCCG